jgi:hypothetical protein
MLKSNGALSTEEREEEIKQMEVYRSHSKFMKNKVTTHHHQLQPTQYRTLSKEHVDYHSASVTDASGLQFSVFSSGTSILSCTLETSMCSSTIVFLLPMIDCLWKRFQGYIEKTIWYARWLLIGCPKAGY